MAISPQTPANSRKAQRQLNLGFPVLSDAGGSVAAAFGVRRTFPDYLREMSRKLGVDLTQFNGEDGWTLPLPAREVIARTGSSTPRSILIIRAGRSRQTSSRRPADAGRPSNLRPDEGELSL